MATRDVSKEVIDGNERVYLWEALDDDDLDGEAVNTPGFPFQSVQVSGTFGGATCTFQGSLDGATWFTLVDPGGNDLAFSAAGGGQVALGRARFVRPLVSSASSTDLDARLFAHQ